MVYLGHIYLQIWIWILGHKDKNNLVALHHILMPLFCVCVEISRSIYIQIDFHFQDLLASFATTLFLYGHQDGWVAQRFFLSLVPMSLGLDSRSWHCICNWSKFASAGFPLSTLIFLLHLKPWSHWHLRCVRDIWLTTSWRHSESIRDVNKHQE